MTTLEYMSRDCKVYAGRLGDYQKISVDDLANGYCKALDEKDDYMIETYLAALMLRFWYQIGRMYERTKTIGLHEKEDFFSILAERINYACKYRAWQKPESTTNAQACINMAIATEIKNQFYFANLDKNKASSNVASLYDPLEGDADRTYADLFEDEDATVAIENNDTDYIIQGYVDENKIVEAIIADTIAYKDVFKHEKKIVKGTDEDGNAVKYTERYSQFWPYKLVQELNALDEEYIKYFTKKYTISYAKFEAAFNAIKKANNQKKYKYLQGTLDTLKSSFDA